MALGIWFLVPSGDVFAGADDAQTVDQREPVADEDAVERLENVIDTVKQNELLEEELGDLLAQVVGDARRRRLLDDLLVAALQ